MPRGKKGRKNKYNENALTTRLLQISMKMDDHIYSGQLVTRSEAADYFHEIAALKLRCLPTNARALQVIEKLTRFMTLILNEGDNSYPSNSHSEYFQMTNQFVGSASPVYSLPDEDRNINIPGQNDIEDLNITDVTSDDVTHKEMDVTNVTDTDVTHQEIHITNVTDDGVTDNQQIKQVNIYQVRNDLPYNKTSIEDIEVIDISDASIEEVIENVPEINDLNIGIERVNTGISTMTLQDEAGSLCEDNTCSQSILDNYKNDITIEVAKDKNRPTGVQKVLQSEIKETSIINNANKHYQTNIPLAAMASYTTIANPKSMVSQPNNVVDLNRKPVHQHSDFIENTNKDKEITNKNNNKLKRRRTKKNKELKVDNGTQICLENAMNSKHVSVEFNGKENNSKPVKKRRNRKKVHEIYNENVVNDLSWVENLRFVREISPSEYDPALSILQDSFWDNFQVPGTWDDLDFNV